MLQHRAILRQILMVLGLSTAAVAQNSKQFPPPSSAGSAIQAAAQASAHDTAASAHEGRSSGSIEILSDTKGVDFGPYLQDLLPKIRVSWYALLSPEDRLKRGALAVEFTILKDGALGAMKLVVTSGDGMLDRAAWDGVIAAAPFGALPTSFKGNELHMRFSFMCNAQASDIVHLRNTPTTGDSAIHAALIRATANSNLPTYPEAARTAKIEGVVSLEATVGTDGKVKDVRVSEGHPSLAEASSQAIRNWRFYPARVNGVLVDDIVQFKVGFELEGDAVRVEVVWPKADLFIASR